MKHASLAPLTLIAMLWAPACLSDAVPRANDGGSPSDASRSDAHLIDASPERRVVALSVGGDHTCAVLDDGNVRCWGEGRLGRLGYADAHGLNDADEPNDIGDDETPTEAGNVPVGGFVVGIAAGDRHTCARLDTGKVRCWGLGYRGRLGYGDEEDIGDNETPDSIGDVPGLANVEQIVAGGEHSCARLEGGAVRCWGSSEFGQLGYGSQSGIISASFAGDVTLGAAAEEIAAGRSHTCARLAGGDVRCWGSSEFGQLGYGNDDSLGDDTDETPNTVDPVALGGAAIRIAAGGNHSCAVLDGGAVRCWGKGDYGQLGHEDTTNIGDISSPTAFDTIDIGKLAVELGASHDHTCAVTDEHKVRCWGLGVARVLGYADTETIGDDEAPSEAGDVAIGEDVAEVHAGYVHTCALLTTGRVRCWGEGYSGRLGYGNTDSVGGNPAHLPYTAGDVPIF